MQRLSTMLSTITEHLVIDRTGLKDHYDFVLKFDRWTPRGVQVAQSQNINPQSDPDSGPPIDIALQEQLGLKLIPERITLPVVVIDNITRPSPN